MKKLALVLLAASALGASDARAAVFTVGPDGTFRWIGEGLAAALASPIGGTHEIRIEQGYYKERLALPAGCCGGKTLIVSGGWLAGFADRIHDPTRTTVDASAGGRVLDVPSMTTGALGLENLTLRNGFLRVTAPNYVQGAGIRAVLDGSARLALTTVHVRSNVIQAYADSAGPDVAMADGAGADIQVQGPTAALQVNGVELAQNGITRTSLATLAAIGGGLHLRVSRGSATLRNARFIGNWIAAGAVDGWGDALSAWVVSPGGLTVEGTVFEANGLGTFSDATVRILAGGITGTVAPEVSLSRCRFLGNGGRVQLFASTTSARVLRVSDSLFANGVLDGIEATSIGAGARLHLTNLTITGHGNTGLKTTVEGAGALTVYNTIAWNNGGIDLTGTRTSAGFNLLGPFAYPHFVDPAAGDYTLSLASPAIDEGTNTPPGGLGTLDLDANPRVANQRVDIGAFERAH
jgi:hypothetical protein